MKAERRKLYLALGLVAAGVGAIGVSVAVALASRSAPVPRALVPDSLTSSESVPVAAAVPVEVPDVTGESLAQAEAVLSAYFSVERREVPTAAPDSARTVLAQDPVGGSLADRGGTVVLWHAPASKAAAVPTSPPSAAYVVCIDPGHQLKSDQRPEPVGPGASETKMRVTGGTTGIQTRIPEYAFTLEVSQRIRTRLEAAGVKVVMARTVNEVSISNAERAQIANQAAADLFLRIHADGNTDRTLRGISVQYPARNRWTAPIFDDSLAAARAVHTAVLKSTGAADRGLVARSDLTGFNWSKVPVCLVECGFMSNPSEDALLASDAYREKLAAGMSSGVLAYLRGE